MKVIIAKTRTTVTAGIDEAGVTKLAFSWKSTYV